MWLFPLPAVVAIGMWLALFFSTGSFEARLFGTAFQVRFWMAGIVVLLLGALVFLIRARMLKEAAL